MNVFIARAVGQILIDTALVILLIGGGFVVLNLGLLSKRDEDRTGRRNPSDVAIVRNVAWPPFEDERPVLRDPGEPFEDDENKPRKIG